MLEFLKISEAMSIALHTCVWLSQNSTSWASARQISREMGFSQHHFAKVVQQLVKAGLLETERGPSGGARLARPAQKITLFDIYLATDGGSGKPGCLLKHTICQGNTCALGQSLTRENAKLITLFKKQTVHAVAQSIKPTIHTTSKKKAPVV